MKVVLIGPNPLTLGGAQKAIHRLGEELSALGEDVCVVSPLRRDSIRIDRGRPLPYKLLSIPSAGNRPRSVYNAVKFAREAARRVATLSPGIVHVHYDLFSGLAGTLLHRSAGTPMIATFHLAGLLDKGILRRQAAGPIVRRARRIVLLNDRLRAQFHRLYRVPKERTAVIPNGCDPNPYIGENRTNPDRTRVTNGGSLLFVGRLEPSKGVELLIDALQLLSGEGGPRLRLDIVGDGSLRKRLRRHAGARGLGDRCTLLGRIDDDDLLRKYATSNLLVLPSLEEGMPLVLLEAMASGLPVVATDVGGVRETLGDYPAKWLVRPEPHSIAEGIQRAMASPRDLSMQRAVAVPSWREVAGSYRNLYEEVLSS